MIVINWTEELGKLVKNLYPELKDGGGWKSKCARGGRQAQRTEAVEQERPWHEERAMTKSAGQKRRYSKWLSVGGRSDLPALRSWGPGSWISPSGQGKALMHYFFVKK